MSETKDIKTKSELMDSFVQIAIAKGYSDYDGEAERFINETVSMYDNLPQPQLTIPQSIAEELLDEDGGVNYTSYVLMVWEEGDWSDKLQKWIENTDKWWFIVDAYLAGKALGVDLVKVVEG